MQQRPLTIVAFVAATVVLASASGCARVKPYERETHAAPVMQDQDPVDEKLDGHVHEYREGSAGGRGVGGGGCGCN